MRKRLIAMGDIHGCAAALDCLLDRLKLQRDDTLVTLGDYVDRGAQSRQVVERLISLADQVCLVPLLGNHELMLLRARDDSAQFEFWLDCGGHETLASYGGGLDAIPAEHFAFLGQCVRYFETPEHLFFHASYDPDLDPVDQPDYALFWEHLAYGIPARHKSNKTAIVGHTAQASGEILDAGHVICIDTWCCGRGWLTALDVETGEIWQADKAGCLRT